MSVRKLVAIGHITRDDLPKTQIGGGVSYSAVTAQRLGLDAQIITKYPINHPFGTLLRKLGIKIHTIPVRNPAFLDSITSFKNTYDDGGNRQQSVSDVQEDITCEDFENFPVIEDDSIILMAPVISEVDFQLFSQFSGSQMLSVTLQGYFREINKDGKVVNKSKNIDKLLTVCQQAMIVIFSVEDLTFDGEFDKKLFSAIKKVSPILVLTKGREGLTIFKDKKTFNIKAFELYRNELIDFTGAGDSCATAFIWFYSKNYDLVSAGIFAALYSALKIKCIAGLNGGVENLPSLEQVTNFVRRNRKRVSSFLDENGTEFTSFMCDLEKI